MAPEKKGAGLSQSPILQRKILFCLCLTAASGFILTALLQSPTSLHSQQEVSEYEERLKQIVRQIDFLRSNLKKEKQRESSVLSRLDRIGFQKSLTRKEIELYRLQRRKAERELRKIQDGIPPLRKKLEQQKQSVSKILVTLYKFGRISYAEMLLQLDDLSSLLSDSKYLTLLARHQNQVVNEYLETLRSLSEAEERQEAKTEEISQLLRNARQKEKELLDQEKTYRDMVEEIARNKSTYEKAIEEQKERAKQLQDLIAQLVRKETSLPIQVLPLYEKKGGLPWPMEGKVVSAFGLQRHPRFRTITVNNGIEIEPQNSFIVRSVHPGVVAYSDHFQGYGNLLIIDHGMTYYSLYGHCSEFYVKKGDTIPAEHPIAKVGDIGSLQGETLYFEIRYKRKPLNPLQWLERR